MSTGAQCDSEITLAAGQANNKSLRHAVQRNAVEQIACDSTHKSINAQQRSLSTRLSREERGLRAQLERLQLEQRCSSSMQSSMDKGMLQDDDDMAISPDYKSSYRRFSIAESAVLEDDVINPYPISVRPTKPSDVTSGVVVVNPSNPAAVDQGSALWAGDPEAIQSVRRARKPLSLRRHDQGSLARSWSLKERPATASTPREPPPLPGGGSSRRPSGDSGSCTPISGCSRAGSLKGGARGGAQRVGGDYSRVQASRNRQVPRQSTSDTRSSISSLTDEDGVKEIGREGENDPLPHRRTKSLKYTKSNKSFMY